MFLKASYDCWEALLYELDMFGKISGCKANLDKTNLGKAKVNTTSEYYRELW